jgi:hypothetical protein
MPLEAALIVLALFLPIHWIVWRQLDRLGDPAYLRRNGVIIVVERALQSHSEPIGEYLGHPIWASVTFMGMRYRFDRILPRQKRDSIAALELFLEPGLVYRTE